MTLAIEIRTILSVRSMRCLLALACSSILAAQEPVVGELDPASLSLDALIERMPPVGEEWIREGNARQLVPAAAEFRERIERVELSDEQWNRALIRTGVLRWRERWPASEPFALSLRAPGWLPRTRIELDPDEPGLASASAGEVLPSHRVHYPRVVLHQELGPLPAGTQHLDFTLQVGVFHRGRLRLPVTLVPTLDEVLPPASTPEHDRAVHESLYLTLERGAYLCGLGSLEGPLHGLARSLRAEIYHGRELREVVTLSPTGNPDGLEPPFDAVKLTCIPAALLDNADARRDWNVRVLGTSEGVLRSWGCDHRWSGTLELTLAELLEREPRIPPRF